MNGLDLCFIRTFVGCAICLITLRASKKSLYVPPEKRCMILTRCIFGTVGFTTYVFAIKYLPLAITSTIWNTAPFWTTLIAFIFLKERLRRLEMVAMFLSFGGVLMITLPQAMPRPAE